MRSFLLLMLIYSLPAFSLCHPERYSFIDYSNSYSDIDFSSLCQIKPGDVIDYCNGEVCGYLAYPKAIRGVKLYEKPDLKSKIIGEIKRCDVIKNFKHHSVFRESGEAEALADIPGWNLKKGNLVKFYFSQEGDYFGCVDNKPVVFYASPPKYKDPSCFTHRSSSKLENWVQHTASNGVSGFSKVESDSFYVGYSGSDERCPEDQKPKK